MDIIDDRIKVARKEHICNCCNDTILPKSKYRDQFLKYEGEVYHWKACARCDFIFHEFINNDLIYSWDGVYTAEDFEFACDAFCRSYICPHCSTYSKLANECDAQHVPSSDCINKIGIVLKNMEFSRETQAPHELKLKPRKESLTKYPIEV